MPDRCQATGNCKIWSACLNSYYFTSNIKFSKVAILRIGVLFSQAGARKVKGMFILFFSGTLKNKLYPAFLNNNIIFVPISA